MSVRIFYFLRENGRSPVEEYVVSINDLRQTAAIQATIEKLAEYNGRLQRPYAAHVEGKIWELRTRFGNRVFYFIQAGNDIILLDGYTKKRDRIEPRILRRVRSYYQEYQLTHKRKIY